MKAIAKRTAAEKRIGRHTRTTPRFRRILVPVDFSKCARRALEYARELMAPPASELILLHVVEPMAYAAELGLPSLAALPRPGDQEHGDRKRLARWHRRIARTGVCIKAELRAGQPYLEITRAAKEFAVDLIVISTHGRTGLKHVFLGSTAERVVRHAECPVLTLRCRP